MAQASAPGSLGASATPPLLFGHRRRLRWLSGLVGGVFVLGLVALAVAAHTWFGRPLRVEWFFSRLAVQCAFEPTEQLRERQLYGKPSRVDQFLDRCPLRSAEQQEIWLDQQLQILRRYDREQLDAARQLQFDWVEHALAVRVADQRWWLHDPSPRLKLELPRLDEVEDARDYPRRLAVLAQGLEQALDAQARAQRASIVPTRAAVERIQSELAALNVLADPEALEAGCSVRFQSFARLSPTEAESLSEAVRALAEARLAPAYSALSLAYSTLSSEVKADHGAWALPEGAAYYEHRVRRHTSAQIDAARLHEEALARLAELEAQLETSLRQLGVRGVVLGNRLERLAAEAPARDPEAHSAATLADLDPVVFAVRATLGSAFADPPPTRYEWSPAELDRVFEPQTTAASGATPIRVDLDLLAAHPRFELPALVLRELIPGRLLRSGWSVNDGPPAALERALSEAAFDAGWSSYATALGAELGLLDHPLERLAWLREEQRRLLAVVVDTGLHQQRWSVERAVEFWVEHSGGPRGEAESRVRASLLDPGAAVAAGYGSMKLSALRQRAAIQLGPAFDLREFHSVVLGHGALPMNLLEQVVDRWLSSRHDLSSTSGRERNLIHAQTSEPFEAAAGAKFRETEHQVQNILLGNALTEL